MKQLIKNNFGKASKTYAESDFIQKKTATLLAAQLSRAIPNFQPKKIFDIGSGTGNLTKQLIKHYPDAIFYLNDISEAMLEESANKLKDKAKFHFIYGDIENLQIKETYDLITSNMCLQWIENLKATIQNMYNHSHLIAISLPLHGTFNSWHQLLKKNGISNAVRPYPTIDTINEITIDLQANLIHTSYEKFVIRFDNPLAVAQYLKKIGANTPYESSSYSKQVFNFLRTHDQACILEYKIGFFILKRNI